VKLAAQLGAGYLVLPFLLRGEMDLDGHPRHGVLLEPERRNKEAVDNIL
jgi:hypothetical protein